MLVNGNEGFIICFLNNIWTLSISSLVMIL